MKKEIAELCTQNTYICTSLACLILISITSVKNIHCLRTPAHSSLCNINHVFKIVVVYRNKKKITEIKYLQRTVLKKNNNLFVGRPVCQRSASYSLLHTVRRRDCPVLVEECRAALVQICGGAPLS